MNDTVRREHLAAPTDPVRALAALREATAAFADAAADSVETLRLGLERLIAATHRPLSDDVASGRFRQDLFYRLSVVELLLPPLRDRLEDVPHLAQAFLESECRRSGRALGWDEAALRRLSQYPWPGNVRELRNAVEKLSVLADGPTITVADVVAYGLPQPSPTTPPHLTPPDDPLHRRVEEAEAMIRELGRTVERLQSQVLVPRDGPLPGGPSPETVADERRTGPGDLGASGASYREQMHEASRQIVARALEEEGTITAAARRLGISRQNLSVKCKQLGLRPG